MPTMAIVGGAGQLPRLLTPLIGPRPGSAAALVLPPEILQAIRTGGTAALARLDELWAEAPFDLTVRDQALNSLLHLAMDSLPFQRPSSWRPETVYPMIAWLIAHGAPLEAENRDGESVLAMAENRLTDYPGTLDAVRTAVQKRRVQREREVLNGAMDAHTEPGSLIRPIDASRPRSRL